MEEMLESLIAFLNCEPFEVFKFDAGLSNFFLQYEENAIVPLMGLFQDDFKFPEVMFSIIHGIEYIGGAKYVKIMMEGLHALWPQAPEWSIVLLIRILNSPKNAELAIFHLSTAKQDCKDAWKQALLRLVQESPEFTVKAAPLLSVIDRDEPFI